MTFLLLPATLLLLHSPLSVRAWGWGYSCNGDGDCSSNSAARWGVGIGIAVLFALLFYFCLRTRRRRAHSANLVYAQNQAEMGRRPTQYHNENQSSFGYGAGSGTGGAVGGYPSQSYGQGQTGNYNAATDNYTGVQAPPPMYSGDNPNSFAPPPGPPPNFSTQHDSTLTSEQRELQQHEENLRRENGQEPAYTPYVVPNK